MLSSNYIIATVGNCLGILSLLCHVAYCDALERVIDDQNDKEKYNKRSVTTKLINYNTEAASLILARSSLVSQPDRLHRVCQVVYCRVLCLPDSKCPSRTARGCTVSSSARI